MAGFLQARARGRDTRRPAVFQDHRLSWSPGDRIPIGRHRTLQVVRVRDDGANELPVLVVEDLS